MLLGRPQYYLLVVALVMLALAASTAPVRAQEASEDAQQTAEDGRQILAFYYAWFDANAWNAGSTGPRGPRRCAINPQVSTSPRM